MARCRAALRRRRRRAGQVVHRGKCLGVFTGGAVINANLAGGDLVVVASSMNVMTFSVMARPEIKRPEDLKGKKIGDLALWIGDRFWPALRGRKMADQAARDFAVIQVGVSQISTMRCAPERSTPRWSMPSWRFWRGATDFASWPIIAKMGINFPTSSAVTTRSFIKRNENTVRKFVRGFVEGVHFAKTQRGPAIKIMQKYLRSSDAAMFDELYEMYIMRNIPRIPWPSPESLKTVLDQMVETDPRVANLQPEQFIDARFFQELDKEGFIQKLWK